MPTFNLNGPLTIDQKLRGEISYIIRKSHSIESTVCEEVAKVCDKDPEFRLTPIEQKAIYQKLLEIKTTSSSQLSNTRQHAILLTHLIFIVSRSEACDNQSKLLDYTKQKTINQENLDATNICNMLYHLSKLPTSEDTQLILEKLLSGLAKNRAERQDMAPNDISTAFSGLENTYFSDVTVQNIVKELTWHINQNTRAKQWFYAEELARSFSGLCIVLSKEIAEEAVQALSPHMQYLTHAEEWLDGRKIAMILKGIQHLPLTAIKETIIKYIIPHLNKSEVESDYLDTMIGSLENTSKNEIIEQFLQAIFPHIPVDATVEYPLLMDNIRKILPGLKLFSGLTIATNILNKLTANLQFPEIDEPTEIEALQWLYHARSHLNQYLDHSAPAEAQSAARAFLQKAIEVFKPIVSIDLETILDHTDSDSSPRTHTTGSDHSLSEEETHQDELVHSMNAQQ